MSKHSATASSLPVGFDQHAKILLILFALHLLVDTLYQYVYPSVNPLRATLIGLTALVILTMPFFRKISGISPLYLFLPIFSSARFDSRGNIWFSSCSASPKEREVSMTKKIYLGADHAGFDLKEKIKVWLDLEKIAYDDCGNTAYNSDDDYPYFAEKVARKVVKNNGLGLLACGSAEGICMAANKLRGARAVNPHDLAQV